MNISSHLMLFFERTDRKIEKKGAKHLKNPVISGVFSVLKKSSKKLKKGVDKLIRS